MGSLTLQSVLLLGWFVASGHLLAKDGKLTAPGVNSATAADSVTLKGRIIRLADTNAVGFRTEKGEIHRLVRNQKSEALFVETNLSSKTLIVKGRLQPRTRALEITANLHSWRDGKQRELYYYCDICAIKTSDPGPCMCCREPMTFVEEE